MVADQTELGEQRPGVAQIESRGIGEGAPERRVANELPPNLFDLTDANAAAEVGQPGVGLDPTEDQRDQRRLAGAVVTDERDPFAVLDQEIDRPEPEVAALDDGIAQTGDDVAAPRRVGHVEAELPRLSRLVDRLEPFHRPLGLRGLAGELFGLIHPEVDDVLVALAGPTDLRLPLLGPFALRLCAVGQCPPLAVVLLVSLPGLGPSPVPLLEVCPPPAAEQRDRLAELVDLGHVGDHPVEEATIVAHEEDGRGLVEHPTLEPSEPGLVEVVRRLVEELDVEA